MKIMAICEIGRAHARHLHDKSFDPEVLADERKDYKRCKQDAIGLAGQLRDAALLDFSLQFIVLLCMEGEDESEAN
jgi:hypothetical protein